jgi:hypothetical protein
MTTLFLLAKSRLNGATDGGCRFAVCQPWHAVDRLVKLSASAMLNSVVMHRDNRNPAGFDLISR